MPRTPDQVKAELSQWAAFHDNSTFNHPGMKGATIGTLEQAAGSREARHVVLDFLFGVPSTKELDSPEWEALIAWIDVSQVGDKWLPQSGFQGEVDLILKECYEFD